MTSQIPLPVQYVTGVPVAAVPFSDQIEAILGWAKDYSSRFVCVANVHMLVEAHSNSDFASVLNRADLVTPDGMPLVWMMRVLGIRRQDRVAGMDIFLALCEKASQRNIKVFLLGSQSAILQRMQARLVREFPGLEIVGLEPLPFRPLTAEEDQKVIEKIHESQAGLVLVSLGCPKQELWMSQHKGKVKAVMIGLGGVFPIYAGIHRRAPGWMRQFGLEWLFRLAQEPKRLWKRYATTIPLFVLLALKQLYATLSKKNCEPLDSLS